MRSTVPGEAKQVCQYCGQPLEEKAVACPVCLHPLSQNDMQQTSGNDIYLMLMRANVLRLRRQYQLAEAQCSEIIRRDPNNAAAHSVLGDIARDQGKRRDAIEWYKMALDLNPGNVSDRKKLEEVIDQVYSGEKDKILQRIQAGVSETIGSAASELKATRLPSALIITLSAMLGVILLVTIIVLVLGRGVAPAPAPAAMQPAGGFVARQTAPLEPAPVERAATATEPKFTDDVAPLETALIEELTHQARAVDPNCKVMRADIDPHDGTVTVEIAMPRLWSRDNTRDGIARVAIPLAKSAANQDQRYSRVVLRATTYQENQPDRLAFVGDATREELSRVPANLRAAELHQVFHSSWWDPELNTPVEAPPSPGAR